MEHFARFFELMPLWQKAAWIVGCLIICWALEGYYPLFRLQYKKWKHASVNLFFLLTTMLVNIVFGLFAVFVFDWVKEYKVGLLYVISLPPWAGLIISLLLFELIGQYLSHYLLHNIKWMWKLHMVHHSDTHVDATTGTRHHPLDFLVREIFALLAVMVTGAPVGYYFFFRICNVFFTYFTHANIRFPLWLDKGLSWVFVTPHMHKFHHHAERPWTDSNYGNIFSIWDRLFGTFVYGDTRKIKYGLDTLEHTPDESIGFQLKLPFNKQIKTDS